MSGRSLIGLAAFDALLLTTGLAVLFAFRGRLDRRTVARYGGLAFWLGASLVGLALTLIGILTTLGPRWWLVLAIALTLAVVAIGIGLRRRPRTERALATDEEKQRYADKAKPLEMRRRRFSCASFRT